MATILPPNEIPVYNESLATLRSQLGDDGYTTAIAHGAALPYEQVGPFALAAVKNLAATEATSP